MNTLSTNPTKANGLLEQAAGSATEQKHGDDHIAEPAAEQQFSTLRAKFEQAGHTFSRTKSLDGSIVYLAGKWGYFRELKGLKAAAAFLAILGGVR